MSKWFDREFRGLKVISVKVSPKTNPNNKRQWVEVTSVRTVVEKFGSQTFPVGSECSGNSRLTDEQLAEVQAAAQANS